MKKWLMIAMAAGFVSSALATAPAAMTVSTNSVMLVPKKPVASTAWATNTVYAQGVVVKNDGYYYFAVDGGRTTNAAPTHTTGDAEATGGGITWRQINHNKRSGIIISMQTTNGMANISFGTSDAVAGSGGKLVGNGHAIMFSPDDNYQGEIHAIRSVASDVIIGVQEF